MQHLNISWDVVTCKVVFFIYLKVLPSGDHLLYLDLVWLIIYQSYTLIPFALPTN